MVVKDILKENYNLLLDNIFLSNELDQRHYELASRAFTGEDTIGKHTRHILNFYESILNSYQTNIIDYETRTRDKNIESHLEAGIAHAKKIAQNIYTLTQHSHIRNPILSYQDNTYKGICTSFARELLVAQEHTIHHNAIIRMILSHDSTFKDLNIDSKYGIAPSTLNYKNSKFGLGKHG